MFEILPETTDRVIVVKASGVLTDADYQSFMPEFEAFLGNRGTVRAYVDWEELEGWDEEGQSGAFLFRSRHRTDFERIAVVGPEKLAESARQLAEQLDCRLRHFLPQDRDAAWAWLNAV
ncbi:MAG: STAS/SEC14 domain-containing protein [Alphaproteobacteria bacterium]|nr:STAS/SEC14 domain-containing protein [Alphaproteobacteria bacterium]